MRAFLKTVGTLVILVALIGGGFYLYRSRQAKAEGREYSLSQVPGDLLAEFRELMRPVVKKTDPSTIPPAEGPGTTEGNEEEPLDGEPKPADPLVAARAHYLAGRFVDAELMLERALAVPGATGTKPADLLTHVRLFRILLKGVQPGARLEGSAAALITMPGGRRMLVMVVDDSPEELEFKAAQGIKSRMKKSEFRDLSIARSRDERQELFEREYRYRHETTRTAGEFLDLGRFSSECGLTSHITYCLERSVKAPGEGVQEILRQEFADAQSVGDANRKALLAGLFQRFYPRSEIAASHYVPDRPEIDVADANGSGSGSTEKKGGIGGVRERRVSKLGNPKVAKLLDEADKYREKGNKYYRKAFSGNGKSADYRDKALAAYRKAQEIYEKVEEGYGVALDRTFKDLQRRIYDLLKSGR